MFEIFVWLVKGDGGEYILLVNLFEDYKFLIIVFDVVGEVDLFYEKVKNMLLNDVDCSKDVKNFENVFFVWCGKFSKCGKLY